MTNTVEPDNTEYIYTDNDFENFISVYIDTNAKSKEQLYSEMCEGFSEIFKSLIKNILKYENRKDFENNVETCCYALFLAKDFETKETLERYDIIFKSITYAIAYVNNWINE